MPELIAWPISAVLDGAEIRDVIVAGYPALDAIYITVRDAAWRTVPGQVISSRWLRTDAGLTVEVDVRHRLDEIDFRWHGTIQSTPGRMLFTFDGVAESDSAANRIGFCMLHPQSLKGRAVHVNGPGGAVSGRFPERISPEQTFVDVQQMTCDVGDGAELEIRLSGELFETEDHRNWSDPGWKTYCTPLSVPCPVWRRRGSAVRQTLELIARSSCDGSAARHADAPVRLEILPRVAGRVPALGLGASCLPDLGSEALETLRSLGPSHLHVELEHGGDWHQRLELAAAEACAIDVPLDIALVAEPDQLAAMSTALARLNRGSGLRVGRVSAFAPDRHTSDAITIFALRAALSDDWAPGLLPAVAGGTRANFAELNRSQDSMGDPDIVTYGLTPQVHHFDDRSIMSTLTAVADGLQQAVSIAGKRPVVVGPITLRPRFIPTLGRPDPLPPDMSGPDVDERQDTWLAAVYLAGALIRIVGAQAATAYRSVGPRGVIAVDGARRPAAEVVDVLAHLAGARVHESSCDDPDVLAVPVIGTRGLTVVAVNLSESTKPLELGGAKIRGLRVLGRPGETTDPALPGRSVIVIDAVPDGTAGPVLRLSR